MEVDITIEQIEFLVARITSCNAPEQFQAERDNDGKNNPIKVFGYKDSNGSIIKMRRSNYGKSIELNIAPASSYAVERTILLPEGFLARKFDRKCKAFKKVFDHVDKMLHIKEQQKANIKVNEVSNVIDKAFPDAIEKDLLK